MALKSTMEIDKPLNKETKPNQTNQVPTTILSIRADIQNCDLYGPLISNSCSLFFGPLVTVSSTLCLVILLSPSWPSAFPAFCQFCLFFCIRLFLFYGPLERQNTIDKLFFVNQYLVWSSIMVVLFYSFENFSLQRWPMISDWSLSDIKSPQVSRTLLSILTDLNDAVFG